MDIRTPLNQCIALIVAGVMFLNPIVTTAAELTLDAAANANTHLGQAGNGVPIVNIATPNGSGLSNNTFRDYNVGSNGLILNNATSKTQSTELGGIIVGNPNLRGQAAQVILNQVTGGNRSTLEGYTEVAGQAARVIVANPHGITCKGCGFINTPRATLTTGKPVMDGERLDRFQVDGGDIAIEGDTLNASNLDQFDLVTRSAKLNAELHARQLNIVTGRNDVQADSLQATPRADDGSAKPLLAIDSSALGGMYAGTIRLVGTEQGVGVKLAGNLAATTGDIQVDANGKVTLAQAASAGNLKLEAQSAELTGKTYAAGSATLRVRDTLQVGQSLAAREQITANAALIDNQGVVEAGVEPDNTRNTRGDLTLTSQTLQNRGSLVANRDLKIDSTATLDNQGGSLKGANVTLTTGQLDNRKGQALADGTLQVTASTVDNRQQGLLNSSGRTQVNVTDTFDNRGGRVVGQAGLKVTATRLDNSASGLVGSDQKAEVTTHALLDNQNSGKLSADRLELTTAGLLNSGGQVLGGDLLIRASADIDNRLGLISGKRLLDLSAVNLNNAGKGNLQSQNTLKVRVATLDNRDNGLLSSKGALSLHGDTLDNRGGLLLADQSLTVTGGHFDNRDKGAATTQGNARVEVAKLTNGNAGHLQSDGRMDLVVTQVDNQAGGRIIAKGDLDAKLGTLNQQGGQLSGLGQLVLTADTVDNQFGASIRGGVGADISARQVLNQQGTIASVGKVKLTARELLDNQGGKVLGDSGLALTVQRLLNQSNGLLSGRDSLSLDGGQLLNSGGLLSSAKHIDIDVSGKLDNSAKGRIISEGGLTLKAAELANNQGGKVSAVGLLDLTTTGLLGNQGGQLVTNAGLMLRSGRLDNSQAGVISAQGHAELHGGTLVNSGKGDIGAASLTLVADELDNSALGRISAAGRIEATLGGLDQHDHGQLVSSTGIELDLQGGQLINRDGGLLRSPGGLLLRQVGAVDNSLAGEISSDQAFTLAATSLNNQGGRVVSKQSLTLRIANALDNSLKGVLSASSGLDVKAASLDNRQGGSLASAAGLKVTLDGLLDNRVDGILNALGLLTVASGELANSERGLLSGKAGVGIATGKLDNTLGGQVISQGELTLTSAELDNRGGTLSSTQAMTVTSADLFNGADTRQRAGWIHSDADLTLTAAKVDGSEGGEISAKGDLLLRVDALIQRQGRLLAEGKLDLDLNGGDLINEGGRINATGPLTIQRLGLLDNRRGEVSSDQSFSLVARRIDNQQGQIISQGRLGLEAAQLFNSDKGLFSGVQGLEVKGTDLDNSASGTLSSKAGELTVNLDGLLDNRELGALASGGKQHITANRLDNRKGVISSDAAITLSVGELLDNRDGGLISATDDLTFDQAGTVVDNRAGQINGQAINFDGKRLDNSNGQLTSRAKLRMTLTEALLNGNGARLTSGGDLLLTAAEVRNGAGKLISQGLLTLNADLLDNQRGGNLASQQNLVLRLKGDLLNGQDGLVFSERGGLDIQAKGLGNQAGTLKSQGTIKVTLDDALDNAAGRVESLQSDLDLNAARLDNSAGGTLSAAKGKLTGVIRGRFDNQGGVAQAQSLSIEATGGVNNQRGYLSALEGDSRIVTTDFDNRGGGLYAAGLLKLEGQQLQNQGAAPGLGGKVGAGRFDFSLAGTLFNGFGQLESESDLLLRAAQIDNRNGSLRALGKTGTSRFIVTGSLLNDNGVLASANQDLDLQIGGLSNSGGQLLHTGQGTFGLASDKVMQAGGLLHTDGLLSIDAASWTNSSVLQARRLELDIGRFVQTASGKLLAVESFKGRGGSWTNHGLLASDGSLQLDLSGTYDGNGRLSSLGDLGLTANDIWLSGAASLAGGAGTGVTARNLLSNAGRLTSVGGLAVNAATLDNSGTLGGAATVKLTANNLSNQRGLLFSGNDMTLRVGSFTNNYGDLYSLGGLDVAGNGSARAALLDNISGSLESAGNMTLAVDELLNRKEHLSAKLKLVGGNVNVYSDDFCDGKGCELYFTATETWQDVIDADSPTAFITAGGKLNFTGNALRNHYSSISAGSDINVNTGVFENKGAGGGEQRNLSASMYTRNRGQYNAFINARNQFNQNPGSLTLDQVMAAAGYPKESIYNVIDNRTPIAGAVVAPAVVQSAGNVTINATQRIDNSVVRAYQAGAGTLQGRGNANADPRQAQTQVRALNPQLPPDLAQRQVNPVTLPSFSLPQGSNGLFRISSQVGQSAASAGALTAAGDRTQAGSGIFISPLAGAASADGSQAQPLVVDGTAAAPGAQGNAGAGLTGLASGVRLVQGVPERSAPSVAHKYLVETNPVLTDLKQFLSSDYLLGELDVKPDQAIKRLGDGLYEQRLIREAVVARTGQRYIDGMTSDETLFRYLMDNAIASKNQLSLRVGVSLSAEQVAALTHDIVWMEEVEVNGEKVLAPVLYLAHANGRLAPNGALIQGRDVNLISGGELVNVGTLRATNNLAVSATHIGNSGLMEAGGRLDMLATDSIRNAQGGVIAGREVSLTALTGDVINERSVTRLEGRAGGEHVTKDLVDAAARIEAANDLTVTAGRDIGNVGGVIKAGGDLDMDATRNLNLTSQQSLDSHEYQRRRVSGYDTSITQYGGEVTAGGDITATAGQDLSIIASDIEARRNLTLSAGNDILLSSAANEEHDYAKGKKGQTKTTTQLDDVHQVGASLKAGGDVQVEAGNDLKMVASKVNAGDEAYLVAGGKLELLAEYDSHYSLYDMSKKGNWGSSKTQRDEVTDVKAVGSEITSGGGTSLVSDGDQLYQGAKIEAGGDLAIISGGAVTFEAVKDMHQESHEKSKGDLAWTSAKGKGTTDETLRQNQLVAQGVLTIKAVDGLKIDIKHIDQATVSQSIDAMVKADPKLAWLKEAEQRGDVDWRRVKEVHDSFKYDQSGLGTGASLVIAIIVTYLTWGAGASLVGAAGNSTIGFAANSVVSAAATNAATSTINNRGNLGAVVKDVTSSDAMKGYVMSALTPGGGSIVSRIALKAALSTVVYGGSLKDNAVQAGLEIAADALSGAIFNEVGDRLMGSGLPKRVAVHAIVGGLIAEAAGGDFRTAALAAGANEALVQLVGDKIFPGEAHDRVLGMTSQLVGMTVAAGLGADAKDQQVAGWVAQQATENNFLRHKEVEAFLAELKTCEANNSCAEVRKRYGDLNAENQERLQALCARDMDACRTEYKLFSDDYQKTHKLLAESMKDVGLKDKYNLGATILSNYQAMQTLVGTAMTKAITDAASEAAGKAGVEVDAEDVGIFGMWLRTVVKAVTNRKGATGGTERRPCCFAAGTLVATPEGDRAIETLKVGDIVWSKPEQGGEPFAAAITATHVRNDQPIYRLTLESTRDDGQVQTETLFVTPSHPFYVPARHDFVPMGELKAGDLLQSLTDGASNSTSSRVASVKLHKLVGETFNLTVDVGHTFYVGQLKTWVHNTGDCGDKYVPNAGSVGNMGEFFKLPGFGAQVYDGSRKTKQIYDGQSVYVATTAIGDNIRSGDKFYLDGGHMNHIEVFDSRNKAKVVLNLDGTVNESKTKVALEQKRRLPK